MLLNRSDGEIVSDALDFEVNYHKNRYSNTISTIIIISKFHDYHYLNQIKCRYRMYQNKNW